MAEEQRDKKNKWLQLAKEADQSSTTFFDNNYRRKLEDNIRHFKSKHHAGSKYNKATYKYRSKRFRPKTRAMIRNNEAMGAVAFFANMDMVSIEPQNPDDPVQVASSQVNKSILEYRFQNTIPWFMMCMGALQEVQKVGVVFSYQSWLYKEKKVNFKSVDEEGEEVTTQEMVVEKDEPSIKLLPPENVRISKSADWTDPINSSPYLIIHWPMYVKDVKAKMEETDEKTGESKWKKLDDGEIMSAQRFSYDSTRSVRESQREDKYDHETSKPLGDYDIVWVHENFFAMPGGDIVYKTLGTEFMLTDPVPIEDVYFHGERPVVMGVGTIEAHTIYPDGLVEITTETQKETNEIINQRRDNVKLVMNKRYFVDRGANVNLKSIVRNVAGGATLMDDPHADVKVVDFQDVTSSAYQEEDRLNAEFDSLAGGFDVSSIMTNRKLGETVGGMNMMRSGGQSLSEYLLKTFSETWFEKVVKQLLKLEQKYETDEVVLAIAAQKAKLWQRYGVDRVTDELLNQELVATVNAGIGSSEPMLKLERFVTASDKYLNIAERQAKLQQPVLSLEEVGKEIYGRLGHKDGARFIVQTEEDGQAQQMMGMVQQLQQAVQELQGQLQDKEADRQAKLLETQMKEEGQDRRKSAELDTRITEKRMDLANPVAGEYGRA